ncbi:oligogalacturonate-specific porin KdgM family protein [Granulosicoccaceae sp. 1_MG-2023]|nr:oligogalacturonate-specific porin KdgM family protein [Granulosicoccaceae sp. 1_MG-2023]
MKNNHRLVFLFSALVFSSAASAVSLDYRHEYKHHTDQHGNRVKISDSLGRLSYSLEAKFAATTEEDGSRSAFSNIARGDSEVDFEYKHPLQGNWYFQVGMPITFGDNKYSLKPQARIGYKASGIPMTTTLRYRRQFTQYAEGEGDDYVQNNITFYMSYGPSDYKYWMELNYYYNEEFDIYNDGRASYEAAFGMGRRFGSWLPYLELGDAGVSSSSDTRQLRTRVGIKYYY